LLGWASFKGYRTYSGFQLAHDASAGLKFAKIGDIPFRFLESVKQSFIMLRGHSESLRSTNGIYLALLLILTVVLSWKWISMCRQGKVWKAAIVPAVLSLAAVLVFMTVTKQHALTARYFYPALLLFALLAALVMEYAGRQYRPVYARLLFCLFGSLTLLSATHIHWKSLLSDILHPPYRRQATELEQHLKPYGLTRGYASFWNAYINTMGVDERIDIAGCYPGPNFLGPFRWLTKPGRFSPAFADKNVFLLLTNEENLLTNKEARPSALLTRAKKLEPFKQYQIYLFEDSNPFIQFGNALTNPGDSFRLTALYYGFLYSESPEFNEESAWLRKGSGWILHGPYEPMPAGVYDFEIRAHIAGDETSTSVKFDVADKQGERIHARATLSRMEDIVIIRNVVIPEKVYDIQFRLLMEGPNVEFRFDSITLTRKS